MRPELLFLSLLAAAGCAPRGEGAVPIHAGTPCSRCGMEIRTLKFACERVEAGSPRFYDALECLRAAENVKLSGRVYVTDYDTGRLAPLDSVFIVHGRFPTPMGGGFAAFSLRGAAEQVAGQTHGDVRSGPDWWRDTGMAVP